MYCNYDILSLISRWPLESVPVLLSFFIPTFIPFLGQCSQGVHANCQQQQQKKTEAAAITPRVSTLCMPATDGTQLIGLKVEAHSMTRQDMTRYDKHVAERWNWFRVHAYIYIIYIYIEQIRNWFSCFDAKWKSWIASHRSHLSSSFSFWLAPDPIFTQYTPCQRLFRLDTSSVPSMQQLHMVCSFACSSYCLSPLHTTLPHIPGWGKTVYKWKSGLCNENASLASTCFFDFFFFLYSFQTTPPKLTCPPKRDRCKQKFHPPTINVQGIC